MSFDDRGDVITSSAKSDDNAEVATLVREKAQ
jgi:hypothetical protein